MTYDGVLMINFVMSGNSRGILCPGAKNNQKHQYEIAGENILQWIQNFPECIFAYENSSPYLDNFKDVSFYLLFSMLAQNNKDFRADLEAV